MFLMSGQRTRICIISPSMGRYGGLESFVLTIARFIGKEANFSVDVVFKEAGAFMLHEDLRAKIEASGGGVTFCGKASSALWRHIRNADIVHLQNPCPDVALMARLAGKPLLINVINHTKNGRSLHQVLWKACLHLAHRRFYISEFVRQTWEQTVKPWPRSQVVFPICELSDLPPLPVEDRRGFVFVARWIENKGLDTLVEAYARSGLDPVAWPLRLLGDGPLRYSIVSRLHELGLEDHVEAPGFLSEREKAESIRRSRFAVIPPNTREDFGLVAIEARHLGVPCLITRDGGVPEAAGEHCLSCGPGDVEGLTQLLRQAAAMPQDEYIKLAEATHGSLAKELVRPEFYASVYRDMLAAN